MSFTEEAGYLPITIESMMDSIRQNINTLFSTDYTVDTFLGTNFYKYFYALIQRLQENEVKTSEIFLRMQEYFAITNEEILRPNTTPTGIFDYFEAAGYLVSVKPMVSADAGKAYICVLTDSGALDYDEVKLELCNLVKDCIVAGVVSEGSESEAITLSNGQSMDFKFNLPDEIPVLLRLTTTLSENNEVVIGTPDEVKQLLFDNITARYRLGLNFEPQKYFSILDAPWAGAVLLEWSDDAGANWHDEIFESEYDELFTFDLADITLVEN